MAGLYTINRSNFSLYTVNEDTGSATLVGPLNINSQADLQSITWAGDSLYAINANNKSLYTINKDTGLAALVGSVGSLGSRNGFFSLTWDGVNLYTIENGGNGLYIINKETGVPTIIGNLTAGSFHSLAWDGSSLFTVNDTNNTLQSVNKETASLTLIGSLGVSGIIAGLTWNGTNFYAMNETNDSLYTINRSTGSATLVGSLGITADWASLTYIPPTTQASSKTITLNSYTADVDDANKVPDTDFTQVQASQDNRLRLLIPAKDQLTGSPASYVDNYLYIAIPQNRELVNVYYDDDLTAPQRSNFSLFQNPSAANGNLKIYKSNTELADSFVNRLIVLELL